MESKRKNVYIVLFVITTIIAGCLAVYFGIMRNKDVRNLEKELAENKELLEQEQQKNQTVSKNDKVKELIQSNEDKISYNKKLSQENNVMFFSIVSCKFYYSNNQRKYNSGKFNDKEKLSVAWLLATKTDAENYEKNIVKFDTKDYVKMQYLNDISQKTFDEEINFNNVENQIKEDAVDCSNYGGGIGAICYKVKSLVFDESVDEYILTVDELHLDNDNIEQVDMIEKIINYETVDYDSSLVDSTYALKYKKSNGNNILISLDLIS